MVLADDFDSPLLFLLGCSLHEGYLKAEIGFISMGLADRPYYLRNEQGQIVASVKLPKLAVKLKRDVTCILAQERFERL